ncbi:MAG: hypothetical protein ACTSPQ_14865 [Candidatus Helarchaeota archaeon]
MSDKSQKTPKPVPVPPKPSPDKEIIEKELPPVDYTPPTPPVKPPKENKKD